MGMNEIILPHFAERYIQEQQQRINAKYQRPTIYLCRECGSRNRFYDRFEHDREFHNLIPPSPFAIPDRLEKLYETVKVLFG